MSSWTSLPAQLHELLGDLSPRRRWGLLVAAAVSFLALAWCLFHEGQTTHRALCASRIFPPAELRSALDTLRQAGIREVRVDSGHILVPESQVLHCERLLAGETAAAPGSGGRIEKALAQSAWPVSESHRQELMDSARAAELTELFRADSNIANIHVMCHRPKRRGFTSEGRMKVLVSVTPRPGRCVSRELEEALRTAAVSTFGLAGPEDVSLINFGPEAKVVHHGASLAPPSPVAAERCDLAALVQADLQRRLAGIPDVEVVVSLRPQPLVRQTGYRPGNEPIPEETSAARVEFLVDVVIPPSASRSLLRPGERPTARGKSTARPRQTQAEVRRKIEQIVASSLPTESNQPSGNFVRVTFREDRQPATPADAVLATVRRFLSAPDSWPVGLAVGGTLLLVVWSLPRWPLRKRLVAEDQLAAAAETVLAPCPQEPGLDQRLAEEAPAPNTTDGGLDLSELRRPEASVLDEVIHRPEPTSATWGREFAMLHDCSADEWRQLLEGEPPPTIAVILARLPAAQSTFVLRLLPTGTRLDVVRRMASLAAPLPAVLHELAVALEERLRGLRQARLEAPIETPKSSSSMFAADAAESGDPLTVEPPPGRKPDPAQMRTPAHFRDLMMLDDESLREVFNSFDLEHWAIALRGADEAVVSKLSHALAPQDAVALGSAIESLGPVRLSDVDAAQCSIAHRLTPLRWRGRRPVRTVTLHQSPA